MPRAQADGIECETFGTPEGLLAAADAVARRARASGALAPLASEAFVLEEAGVRFAVRRIAGRPPPAGTGAPPPADPFADPDPALRVPFPSDTHWCLLNKFPVLDRHLLLVTRRFAPQEAWLDAADWAALAAGLAAVDGLGFYNGGAEAGASQPHKHLQLVPLAALAAPGAGAAAADAALPIAPWLAAAPPGPGPFALPDPPFAHAFARLPAGAWADLPAAAGALAAAAEAALAAVGVRAAPGPDGLRQSAPYNLLATRRWLLAVPRRRGEVHGVPVNALGFAGSLVVVDPAGLEHLRRVGPLAVLRAVAEPRA
jgi:ATP adenylyltransferase